MRLLNANTLAINNYYGDVPPYAILSHVVRTPTIFRQLFYTEGRPRYIPFIVYSSEIV